VLPLITEEIRESIFAEIAEDVHGWRKKMIHYFKEDNPEVNSAIIQIATFTDLDPKAVATGAYMIYKMLEIAAKNTPTIGNILEMELD